MIIVMIADQTIRFGRECPAACGRQPQQQSQ
jgi:hypothetical protein